jgi:hypothetical protein
MSESYVVVVVPDYHREDPCRFCDPCMKGINTIRFLLAVGMVVTGTLALLGPWAENSTGSGPCQIPQAAVTLWDRPDPTRYDYSVADMQATASFAVTAVTLVYMAGLLLWAMFHNECQQHPGGYYHQRSRKDVCMEQFLFGLLCAALVSGCIALICWTAFGHHGIIDSQQDCRVDLKTVNGGYYVFCGFLGTVSGLIAVSLLIGYLHLCK